MTYYQYFEKLINERRIVSQNYFYLHRLQALHDSDIEHPAIVRYEAINNEYEKLMKAFEDGTINPDDEVPADAPTLLV